MYSVQQLSFQVENGLASRGDAREMTPVLMLLINEIPRQSISTCYDTYFYTTSIRHKSLNRLMKYMEYVATKSTRLFLYVLEVCTNQRLWHRKNGRVTGHEREATHKRPKKVCLG